MNIIDWKELRKQKLVLLEIVLTTKSKKKAKALDGVINLIDSLQDGAVETGAYKLEEVFGKKFAKHKI